MTTLLFILLGAPEEHLRQMRLKRMLRGLQRRPVVQPQGAG